jgi:hypothetical protein
MEPGHYASPLEEALSHGSQRVAQFASLAAAAAQVVIQRRALHDALTAGQADRAARLLRQQQQALHQQARLSWAPAHDQNWLTRAGLIQTARAWAGAASHADTDPAAASALRKCEDRLRTLHPYAMNRYDRLRADGTSPLDAMQQAAPMFARPSHVRTGEPVTPRPALATSAGHDIGPASGHAANAAVGELESRPAKDEQTELRGQQIAERLQASARSTGRLPLGPDELAMILESVTNLPEEVITRIARRTGENGRGAEHPAVLVAAASFPRTAADAITASVTSRSATTARHTAPVRVPDVTAKSGPMM